MNAVFEKTRELGQALMESEEYLAMKAAEDVAMANQEAADLMAQYLERKEQMEDLMRAGTPEPTRIAELGSEMEDIQKRIRETPDIQALTLARQKFDGLINQVNSVLQFIITGQMDDPDAEPEGGCTGSCATCRGCR